MELMRIVIIFLVLAGLHWVNPSSMPAQLSDAVAADSIALTLPEKISVVNKILTYRHELFGQPVTLDACTLAASLGSGSEDLRPRIDPAFRARVHGTPPFSCVYAFGAERKDPNGVVVSFGQFRPERGERIPDGRPRRVKRTIVVAIYVGNPVSQVEHQEEWVLQQVNGESWWVVVTLRVFGFVVS